MFLFVSNTESETAKLGRAIGEALVEGVVIGLNGTLGAGKTRLTQAIGSALEIKDGNVVSPTYTICTPHEGRLILVHLDAYRINHPEEVDELGLDEMVEQGAVIVIEWAEKFVEILPPLDLQIDVVPVDESTREFRIVGKTELGKEISTTVKAALGN